MNSGSLFQGLNSALPKSPKKVNNPFETNPYRWTCLRTFYGAVVCTVVAAAIRCAIRQQRPHGLDIQRQHGFVGVPYSCVFISTWNAHFQWRSSGWHIPLPRNEYVSWATSTNALNVNTLSLSLSLSLSPAATVMFAHYYTNWMLLDAGPVPDTYMPFFFFLSLSHLILMLLLLSCCSSCFPAGAPRIFCFVFLFFVTSIFTSTICTI